jgi:hypothetical protein
MSRTEPSIAAQSFSPSGRAVEELFGGAFDLASGHVSHRSHLNARICRVVGYFVAVIRGVLEASRQAGPRLCSCPRRHIVWP